MSRRILWLDNDPGQIRGITKALEAAGNEVVVCRTVSSAEQYIRTEKFDLVVLDVMIPITAAEVADYSYKETEDTLSTGLVFYRRVRDFLLANNTPVLVVTVRIDNDIVSAFREAGLPSERFVTRYAVRNTQTLLARIAEVTAGVIVAPGDARA
jgi:CheY-like chemotaxis protein